MFLRLLSLRLSAVSLLRCIFRSEIQNVNSGVLRVFLSLRDARDAF